jgi:hypothetical protein
VLVFVRHDGGITWVLPLTPTPLPTRPIPNRTEAWGEGAPLTAPVESMRMTGSSRPHAGRSVQSTGKLGIHRPVASLALDERFSCATVPSRPILDRRTCGGENLPPALLGLQDQRVFRQEKHAVGLEVCPDVGFAGGPSDLNAVDHGSRSEAEMEAQVIGTLVTATGADLIDLSLATGGKANDGTDGGPVTDLADEFQDGPMIGVGRLVEHDGGPRAGIGNDDINKAIVSEIAENSAAAALDDVQGTADGPGNVNKPAFALLEEDVALAIGAAVVVLLDGILQMTGSGEYFAFTIVVQVNKSAPPGDQGERTDADTGGGGNILEQEIAQVAVEGGDLVLVIGDEDVWQAIAIVIGRIGAHGALFVAELIKGHAGQQADFLEGAVAAVTEEIILHDIVTDEDVRPAITVKIRADHPHSITTVTTDAGAFGDIFERAVAPVAVKAIGHRWIRARIAIHGNAGAGAGLKGIEIKVQVIGDVKIQMAVTIKVKKGTASAEGCIPHPCEFSDIGERAVAVIAEERVATKVGDEDVFVAVVIVIGDGAAQGVAGITSSTRGGDIGEGAVAIVAIEGVDRRCVGCR